MNPPTPVETFVALRGKLIDIERAGNDYCEARAGEAIVLLGVLLPILEDPKRAAAAELYEALDELTNARIDESAADHERSYRNARAALAKARGESPDAN